MRIQNNITALNTHRQYGIANNSVASSAEKLASGYRINRAGDDAAGLAISEKMRAQIRGLNMASKNSQDAVSLVQTAEGALQSTHDILQRMRELAVQAASDTNETTIDRNALNLEFQQLIKEIDDTADKTRFNDQNIIDGTFAKTVASLKTITGTFTGTAIIGNSNAGDYNFKVVQKTFGAAAAQSATGSVTGAATGNYSSAAVGYTGGTGLTDSAALNGVWSFSYDEKTQTFMMKNGDVTMTAVAPTTAVAAGDTFDLDFGTLGKLTLTSTGAKDFSVPANRADLYQEIADAMQDVSLTVSGGVNFEAGVTKFYATMDGASDVELKVGATKASFTNGITLTFDPLTANDLKRVNDTDNKTAKDSDFTLAKMVGKITVETKSREGLIIQTGANQGDELQINIAKMNATYLGVKYADISTQASASYAITQSNKAINEVSTQRASLGALQNRLNFKIANLDNSSENLQAAESRIRDVDMAKEMTEFSKKNILVQAATAMLAQANAAPQNVLSLLR